MTIFLQAIQVRHERRVRLLFTNSLAGGAFGIPAPSYYVITSVDGIATPPNVKEAYVISGNPGVVELSLDAPLVSGALYKMSAVGVPATDSSVTGSDATLNFRWGLTTALVNVEKDFANKDAVLYGIDLIWNGTDFQETATGDLDRIAGPPNVSKALNRAAVTDSGDLPWDTKYGAGIRQFVDSPSPAAGTLRGNLAAQLLRDPRVKSVKVVVDIEDDQTFLYATPTLISGEVINRVSITVPNDT